MTVRTVWVLATSEQQAETIRALLTDGMPDLWLGGALQLDHDTEKGARRALAASQTWLLMGADREYASRMAVWPVTLGQGD